VSPHDLEAIDEPTVHHEETDVNIRAIFAFGGGLAIIAVLIHLAVWGLFMYFDGRETGGATGHALATGEPRLPPEPRLQIAPREDLANFRAREDEILNGYRWVNKEAGVVRIPISEAMKMTVQRGLPVRQAQERAGQPQGQK
jgi:hypothetical protein